MNDNNLISLRDRTETELREIARAGGKASAEARRERKSMKERIAIAMETQTDDGGTFGDVAAAQLVMSAVGGDLRALRLIGDYLGEFKQTIDLNNHNEIAMTKEEAGAIYEIGINQMAKELAIKMETHRDGPLTRTPLFDRAVEVLGLSVSDMMSDAMKRSE